MHLPCIFVHSYVIHKPPTMRPPCYGAYRLYHYTIDSDTILTFSVLDNPCSNGMPETLSDGSPLLCSVAARFAFPIQLSRLWCFILQMKSRENTKLQNKLNYRTVCSTGYWCHLGASATNSLCCPGGELFEARPQFELATLSILQ